MQKKKMTEVNHKLTLNFKTYLNIDDGQQKWSETFFKKIIIQKSVYCISTEYPTKGYIIARLAGEDMEIITLGVDKGNRRMGVAFKILQELYKLSQAKKVERILLEVSIENMAGIKLYKKFGFVTYSIREGYYSIKKNNAYLMEKKVIL